MRDNETSRLFLQHRLQNCWYNPHFIMRYTPLFIYFLALTFFPGTAFLPSGLPIASCSTSRPLGCFLTVVAPFFGVVSFSSAFAAGVAGFSAAFAAGVAGLAASPLGFSPAAWGVASPVLAFLFFFFFFFFPSEAGVPPGVVAAAPVVGSALLKPNRLFKVSQVRSANLIRSGLKFVENE